METIQNIPNVQSDEVIIIYSIIKIRKLWHVDSTYQFPIFGLGSCRDVSEPKACVLNLFSPFLLH